jgi:Leucine-rich repeat (LRR) protein
MIYYNKQMKVDLSHGHLDEIKNYKLGDITELKLNNNKLIELSEWINKCVNLQLLDCSYNQLTSLPESLPTTIQWLYCYNNQLTRLPESLPDSLQKLYCDNNQLMSLPENLPTSLQHLYCGHNQLTSLPESLPTSLQILHCSYNQLTSLPKSLLISLQYLYCSDNQLTSLPESLPNSLQYLDCSYNQLTSLPMSILNCRFLTVINYSNNQTETIHPAITRFLNRTKNRNITVYNDRQSVHNGNVQESVRQSILNILSTRLD